MEHWTLTGGGLKDLIGIEDQGWCLACGEFGHKVVRCPFQEEEEVLTAPKNQWSRWNPYPSRIRWDGGWEDLFRADRGWCLVCGEFVHEVGCCPFQEEEEDFPPGETKEGSVDGSCQSASTSGKHVTEKLKKDAVTDEEMMGNDSRYSETGQDSADGPSIQDLHDETSVHDCDIRISEDTMDNSNFLQDLHSDEEKTVNEDDSMSSETVHDCVASNQVDWVQKSQQSPNNLENSMGYHGERNKEHASFVVTPVKAPNRLKPLEETFDVTNVSGLESSNSSSDSFLADLYPGMVAKMQNGPSEIGGVLSMDVGKQYRVDVDILMQDEEDLPGYVLVK
ncbi:UNVERIFIED_CONTAM: hypothetical protein FKN15_060661 [Acipenser sinensis]